MRAAAIIRLGMLLWGCLWGCVAQAHERSESTSHWTFTTGELHGVVAARTREVTRLTVPGDNYASLAQIFAAHVERSVSASVDGAPCQLKQTPSLLDSEPGYLRVDVRMGCRAGDLLALKVETFFAVAPSHHHFLYIESAATNREAILTASAPLLELRSTASAHKTGFLQFIGMGIEHIGTGIDHLAFLLALLISARTPRQVLAIVTGFTLGHSLTLSLAVLGVVQANRGAVECLIGFTIALAAAQNLIRGEREGRTAGLAAVAITASMLLIPAGARPDMPATLIVAVALVAGSAIWLAGIRLAGPRLAGIRFAGRGLAGVRFAGTEPADMRALEFSNSARFNMAMGFGLVHGLGFAGALQDLHLPRSLLLRTLLGFNIGVEVGQIIVVAIAIALVRLVGMTAPATTGRSDMWATFASAALLATGLAWFFTRAVVIV